VGQEIYKKSFEKLSNGVHPMRYEELSNGVHPMRYEELSESKFWFCLFRDAKIGDKERVEYLLNETVQIANMLAKSILTLKGK